MVRASQFNRHFRQCPTARQKKKTVESVEKTKAAEKPRKDLSKSASTKLRLALQSKPYSDKDGPPQSPSRERRKRARQLGADKPRRKRKRRGDLEMELKANSPISMPVRN